VNVVATLSCESVAVMAFRSGGVFMGGSGGRGYIWCFLVSGYWNGLVILVVPQYYASIKFRI